MAINYIGTGLSLVTLGLETGMDLPELSSISTTDTLGGEAGTNTGSGTVPSDPTFTVTETDGGLSVLLTDCDSGTTNTVQYYNKQTNVWSTAESITKNVAKSLSLDVGYYWIRINSTGTGGTSVGIDDAYVLGVNDRDAEKFFIVVMSTLAGDDTVKSIVGTDSDGDYAIYPSRFVPVGNVYPQITVDLKMKESEQAFKAGYYDLQIIFWVKDNSGSEIEKCWNFRERMEALFNREGDDYNVINTSSNNNLRVANIKRRFGEFGHDHEHNKFFCDYRFDVIISEGESHADADAGDKTWV